MPRSEIAATAMALTLTLTVGACLAFPALAETDQFPSQSSGQPVPDVGNVKPADTQKRQEHVGTAEALQEARETDRLLRWLNESALWTGANEPTRLRSIRFR